MSATPTEVATRWFNEIWPVAIKGITWLTVREGRIVEGWDAWDSTGLFAQCGGATVDPRLLK